MTKFVFNFLNSVQEANDNFSNFQISDVFNVESNISIDFQDLEVFRGSEYGGLSIQKNLICFDANCENNGCIKLENEIQMLSNTIDGRFLLLLTKNNYIYLIYTPTRRIIYKQEVKTGGALIKKAVILSVDNSMSEIWLFFNGIVKIYRNINFCELEKAMLSNDDNRKRELLSQIKIVDSHFSFLRADDELLDIQVMKALDCNQFFMAILYADNLIVLTGNFRTQSSQIDCVYETDLSNYDIDLGNVKKPCMQLSQDEIHIFLIDANNQLWIFNFIIGCLFERLKTTDCLFIDVSLTPGFVTIIKQQKNNKNVIDILKFPSLESLECFDISSPTIICPIPRVNDPIFVIYRCEVDSQRIFLKSIRRLDPNLRLLEIIATNNFGSAFKFAKSFSLDMEPIYIKNLQYLMDLVKIEQVITEKQYYTMLTCMKEIKIFFDFEMFQSMLSVVMPTVDDQGFILQQLREKTKMSPESEKRTYFLTLIDNEISQFELYKEFCLQSDYQMDKWAQFRVMNRVDVLYLTLHCDNLNLLKPVWKTIRDDINSIYKHNKQFCEYLKNLCSQMIEQQRKVSDFQILFDWLIKKIFPRQVNHAPNLLSNLTIMFENMIRALEATHNNSYRLFAIDSLHKSISQLHIIQHEARTAIEKANVEVAGLLSFVEYQNPALPLHQLHLDLMQLDTLHTVYNLDLNLNALASETASTLASRILDKINVNELTNDISMSKIKKFLKEFKLRPCEFFYDYLVCLTLKLRGQMLDDIESRFIALLPNIEDKQIRLDCLEQFVSKADVPFNEALSSIIIKEIGLNSTSNPTVQKLKVLQRKSGTTPIFNKYGIKFKNIDNVKPERILLQMLLIETQLSLETKENDVLDIASFYNLDILSVNKVKCKVYISNIVTATNLIANANLSKLKTILNNKQYPESTTKILVNASFEYLMCLWQEQKHMSYCNLIFVLEIASWLASKFTDNPLKTRWITGFEIMRYCVSMRYDNEDQSISLIDYFGIDASPLLFLDGQLGQIKKDLSEKIQRAYQSVKAMSNYNHYDVNKAIWDSIAIVFEFCLNNLTKADTFIVEICEEIIQSYIDISISENEDYLALCLVYTHLSLVSKLGFKEPPHQQHFLIMNYMKCIQNINIGSNSYLMWRIIGLLETIFNLYMEHKMGYMYENYLISMSMLSYLSSLIRCYAELESTNTFELIKLPYTYQEMAKKHETFVTIIPAIKTGLAVVFSMYSTEFTENIAGFIKEWLLLVKTFVDQGLFLTGYVAGINLLSLIVEEQHQARLETILKSEAMKNVYLRMLDINFRSSNFDKPFILSLVLSLPKNKIVERLSKEMIGCKSNRKAIATCCIIWEMLLYTNKMFDQTEKNSYLQSIATSAKMYYWAIKLKPYEILMFRTCDDQHQKALRLQLLHNHAISFEFIESYLVDYDMLTDDWKFELFHDLFDQDFSKCADIDSYKIKVENTIKRANTLWLSIPIENRSYLKVTHYLSKVATMTSPYHYEILDYIFSIMNIVTFENENETKIIKHLYMWPRISAVGVNEQLACERYYDPSTSSKSATASFLTNTRLPFHLFMYDDPMIVLESELHSSNVSNWLNIYQILKKLGSINKTKINHDLLQLKTAENIFRDFIENSQTNNEEIFLGNLFEINCPWFKEIVNIAMSFLDRLLINSSFIDFIDKRINELSVREYREYLLNEAMQWLKGRLLSENCNGREKLIEWGREKRRMKEKLEVDKILFKNDLFKPLYSDNGNQYRIVMESILKNELLSNNLSRRDKNKIVDAIYEISKLTKIDLREFAFHLTCLDLKLINEDIDLSSGDHESSMLNMSLNGSINDDKPALDIERDIDIKKIELLCIEYKTRQSVTADLMTFISENNLTIEQWMHVFVYLFRCQEPGEDKNVDSLRNLEMYTLFLLVVDMHSVDYGMNLFVSCNHQKLIDFLTQFRMSDKTDYVKRIYCGDKYNKGNLRPDHKVDQKTLSTLRDIFVLCPTTIKRNDPIIERIIRDINI